jgi:parallel beta-helix repeat protein
LEDKKTNKRCAILLVSVTILVLGFVGTASATNWSVDGSGGSDFTGIQDAINNASAGDTIIVHSGVYYENVVVDKSVTLKGIDQPVVDANSSGRAITLTEDRITLVGFNATNSGSSGSDVGIKVTSNNNTITGNNVSNNGVGIGLYYSSNNNTITGNNVSNNGGGIGLYYSSNNKIYFNNFRNNVVILYSIYDSTNIWNSPSEMTYTYDGTIYESYLGNYWDDYEGTDAEGDGIGDTHYSIDSEKDESDDYPLMKPIENYILPTSAPA